MTEPLILEVEEFFTQCVFISVFRGLGFVPRVLFALMGFFPGIDFGDGVIGCGSQCFLFADDRDPVVYGCFVICLYSV